MKVAIDSGPLKTGHKVRGIGVHTRELVKSLQIETKGSDVEINSVDFTKADLNKYDIVHYQHFHPFFLSIPTNKPKAKTVITIHDLIPLIFPKHYPPGIQGKLTMWRQKSLLNNIDAVITISKTSKKDICNLLDIDPKKVFVVNLAPRSIFRKLHARDWDGDTRKKYKLPKKFVLYVGDINYNKNIPALLEGCQKARIPLVIVGKQAKEIEEMGLDLPSVEGPRDWVRFVFDIPHPELSHYKNILNKVGNGGVIRTGFVSDKDLVRIYNQATIYCQPSFYEGFGFPVLEAMACGVPVIASKTQALKEVAEDAAFFFSPKSSTELSNKIKQLLGSKKTREDLVRKGNKRVKKFTWEKTAKETLDVYENIN